PPKVTEVGGDKQSNHTVFEWIVNVVSQEDDGSWWMVFREKISSTYVFKEKEHKQELHTDGHFRLTAEGKLAENSTIAAMSDPTQLFPALPVDADSLAKGWQSVKSLDDTQQYFHLLADNSDTPAGEWRFVEEPRTALDVIYEMKTLRDYTFDREAGRIRKFA